MGKRKRNALLWQIVHPRYQMPSYLFGTMHIADSKAKALLSNVEPRLLECNLLALEVDLVQLHATNIQQILLPDNQSLGDFLPEKKLLKLRKTSLKTFDFELENLERYRPLIIISMLTEQLLSRTEIIKPDMQLWDFAKANDLERCGLLPLDSELEVIQRIPVEWQVSALVKTLKNSRALHRELKNMSRWYLAADLQAIHKASRKGAGSMRKALLLDRNKLMAKRFELLAATQPVFAAVGAGHLVGGKGMLKLLKDRGLQVKPVPWDL
jgi:hypothetical protein